MILSRNSLCWLCLFIVSCTVNKNSIKLASSNFTDEIEVQQNLVFTFDRALAADSVLNKWDSAAYITFTPAVKGLFRWNKPDELIFSPAGSFKASTDYQAVFNEALTLKSNKNFNIDELVPLTFHTPYLALKATEAFWVRSDKSPGNIALNLTLNFNYRVDGNETGRLTRLFVNGKPVSFEVKGNTSDKQVNLHVDGIPKEDIHQSSIEIKIEKGIHCLESDYKSTKEITYSHTVPDPEKMEITQVQGILDNELSSLEINTNQPVENTASLAQLIKVTPEVPFTIETMESGFVLKGNFAAGATYELTVSKKLKGILGGEMINDFLAIVPFGQQEPAISFSSAKGIYLSSKSSKTLGINIVNVPRIKVAVTRIFENNIQAYMRSNRYNEYYGEDEGYDFSYGDYNLDELGDVVMKQEYETKNLAKVNGAHLLNLDFSGQGQFRGIYLVKVESDGDLWRKAVKLISVSDIGLIARQTENEIYVFANAIINMRAMPGVKVNFTSKNNQVLYTATTNKDGVAVFSDIKSRFPGFKVSMITARAGDDFNYMIFNDTRVENSRYDVGGARQDESGFQAFIYGDREIYRPGETVHNNIIIRNNSRETVSDIPVKVKYLLPNGRELKTFRLQLDREGSCEVNTEIPEAAVTGTYTIEVYTANDLLIQNKTISVEEFIPDRINVKVNTGKESYLLRDSIVAGISAFNLFGPPAANRNYEAEFTFSKKYFYAKDFPSYNFNIKGSDKLTFPSVLRQGKTNASGSASEGFSVDSAYSDEGILTGKIFVTVFDETGRPVNRINQFDIFTQQKFYGIKINDYYVAANNEMQIGIAVTDAKGNAAEATSARIQVVKVNWHTIMERTYDTHYRYVSQREEEVISDKTMIISQGGSVLPFVPNESGEYLVRISRPGAEKYVESQFYAYRWGSTSNTSFRVNNEGQVDITTDKEKYTPGEKAKILFKTPFAGKLLVTIEREKVYEYFFLNTDKKAASLTLPLNEEYLPNIYVTATLFKPLDDGSLPLTIAHGFANINIENPSNVIPVNIRVVEKSHSKTKQDIVIKTNARSDVEVTVAVVDEGIMQLKNSQTPDPYKYFYRKQALEVNSYDVYPYLLPDLKLKRPATGGDGYDLQKRVNPLNNKRVKLVAYWSGILKTNSSGEARCAFDIPQFSGDLRVMAVAYKGKSFGSAEKHIKVADPVVISASIPRFLSPGDTLQMPVTITNTLDKSTNIQTAVSLTGPLQITGQGMQALSLGASSEGRIVYKVVAQKATGQGSVEVTADAGGIKYTDKTEITIRPPASLQKLSDAGSIAAGSTKQLDLKANFIPSSMSGKLLLSNSPVVRFTDQLEYLLDYPYGCVEQTTSIAFPQLYYADLIRSIKNKPGRPVNITRNVQAAISKLQSMQMYNGGLSYWPGGEKDSWWGSAYACHFLMEAKRAGYEVSQASLDKIIAYLGVKANSKAESEYYFYDVNNKGYYKKYAAREIFYSLYVMAVYGKPDRATMNYYKYQVNKMTLDSRYMLATSFLVCGDRKSYTDLLPGAFEGDRSGKESGGSFSSYVRDEALALSGLLEADPDNMQIPVMVNHLSKQLKIEKYLSTQERAFAFLALGKFMNRQKENKVTALVSVEGNKLGEFAGNDLVISKGIVNKVVSVNVRGNGSIFYSWEEEGLTTDGAFKQEDNFLRIRKTFLTRFGKPVQSNSFKQNDLVVVKLTLENLERSAISNVVITDMLPAGFEIENPRIGAVPELSWIKDNTYPEYTDVRDDRINLFTSADHTVKNYYYLVRAVSTGKFRMGPVSADAMYNGEYHSYNGAGTIQVVE